MTEAGGVLVERYWDRVYAYAYRLTLNRSDAEDIAQETFLRAFTKVAEYTPDGQFKAWLLTITTNLFLDLKKSPRAREVTSDKIDHRTLLQIGPDEEFHRKELIAALYEVMQTLSDEQQVVILLRGIERLDYPQIADILKVKETTARWHMYEARRILRQKLSRAYPEWDLTNE